MPKKPIPIIYSDDKLLVINKPTGIPASRTGSEQLIDILSGQLGTRESDKLQFIHRIDKDASGIMLLAKTKEAQAILSQYFEQGLIRKTYLGLVAGFVQDEQGTIDAPLAQCKRDYQLMRIDRKRGKKAVTDYKVLANFGAVSLLAIYPRSERTHQIRVHLSSIGLGLAIDPLYSSNQPLMLSSFKPGYRFGKDKKESPLIDRLTLHSYQLELPATERDRPCCFVAGLDKKFAAVIKMLNKHNPNGPDAFTNTGDFENIISAGRLY